MFTNRRTEQEVGILNRINDNEDQVKRFRGLFKLRFSDFHVNEIDVNGKVVHLDSYELPPEDTELTNLPTEEDVSIQEWISEDIRSSVKKLQDECDETGLDNQRIQINVTSASKEIRTKIHRWVGHFDRLMSVTIDKDGKKLIVISRPSQRDKKKFARRPYNRAKFTHCVLYKEGIDTSDAISYLSKKLRIHTRHIAFAGTKDKQAKTVQQICFSNMDVKRLLAINECSLHSKLGNFSYRPTSLYLGALQGNRFKILIRDVQAESHDAISYAIKLLAENGFINYFGLQRFGTFKFPTHLVGKALLQMNWLQAFDLILQPNERDPVYMKKAKKIWSEQRDPVAASCEIPGHVKTIDSSLIIGLSKYYAVKDYWAAFKSLPRNTRTLYFHSYQSYLWNQLASYRIQKFGLKPVAGDLVFINADGNAYSGEDLELEEAALGLEDQALNPEAANAKLVRPTTVKVLAEHDAVNFTIFDVVIPLEGSDLTMPENCNLKSYAEQLLAENGVGGSFQSFTPRSELPRGSYRKVVVLPKEVSHQVIPYNSHDNLDSFIPSDLDLLEQKHKSKTPLTCSHPISDQMPKTKDKTAVIVEFSLPSCSYATMALREILECTEVQSAQQEADAGSKRTYDELKSKDPIVAKKLKEDETLTQRSGGNSVPGESEMTTG